MPSSSPPNWIVQPDKQLTNGAGGGGKPNKSEATVLVGLAIAVCELFRDPECEPYASFRGSHDRGSHRETYKLKSTSFRQWLLRTYYFKRPELPNQAPCVSDRNVKGPGAVRRPG
jgi:hypothetical protein